MTSIVGSTVFLNVKITKVVKIKVKSTCFFHFFFQTRITATFKQDTCSQSKNELKTFSRQSSKNKLTQQDSQNCESSKAPCAKLSTMNIGRSLSSDCKTRKIIPHVKEKNTTSKKMIQFVSQQLSKHHKSKNEQKELNDKKKAPMFDTVMPFYVFLMKKNRAT